MRGGLDETLARLARREEARRRRSAEQGAEVDDGTSTLAFEATGRGTTEPTPPGPALIGPALIGPARPGAAPTGPGHPGAAPEGPARNGSGWTGPVASAAGGSDPVEEVAEAVRRVVAARPGLSVVLRIEYDGRTYPLRVERTDAGARGERTDADTRIAIDPPARPSPAMPSPARPSPAMPPPAWPSPTTPPPAWPPADRTPPAWTPPAREMPGVDPAARLAELIRRDPTLLDNDD
ncbi:hypothetical protein ACIG87_16505 [Micromonospora sp. NPDC051925]|uniref:hypothetical protein n=1 Tax=Micromonospora sp. NPDC051925 TaxID=3364288 RepID=UPI0037CCACB7